MTIRYSLILRLLFICVLLDACSLERSENALYSNTIEPSYFPVDGYPYFSSHLFVDKIYANSNAIIPCQSLEDIRVASRLGFPSIELNVHETADTRFVTIHGVKGCFGEQVVKKDGSSVTNISISDVDYSFIQDSLIYRSSQPEYQTAIPTLEDALKVCEENGISPHICGSYNERLFSIVSGFHVTPIWGCYSSRDAIRTRKKTNGVIACWSFLDNEEEIVSLCKKIGPPYIHFIASDVLHDRDGNLMLSDSRLKSLIARVHDTGCRLGFAACYTPERLTQRLWSLGFDYASSGWAVNKFSRGCLLQIDSLASSSIVTNGHLDENGLLLNDECVLTVKCEETPFLSKGFLTLSFKGRIHIKMGDYINIDIDSMGEELSFSTYYLEQKPVFEIVSKGDVEVFSLAYSADIC